MGEAKIDINAFAGMNDVNTAFFAGEGIVSPHIILNADVDTANAVNKRTGLSPYITLANAHSLWACPLAMLCAADNKLYNISTGTAVLLSSIAGLPDEPLSYCVCENKIYISNKYWKGIFDPNTGTISDWGMPVPSGPMLLSGQGNLPAGIYNVTFTTADGTSLSGNGPIASITLTAPGGIQILNRPANAIVWATDQNSHIFYYVGPADHIVDIPTVEPLPTFTCSPPYNLSDITYAFGRIWGAVGSTLYYSEPFEPALFKLTTNKFDFSFDITLIAAVSTGLFIGGVEKTIFLRGTDPLEMQQLDAGSGSIKGTLVYCDNVPYLADILGLPEKVFTDVPVWRTVDGIVAGNASGRLFNLTRDKLNMGTPTKGAALYRKNTGVFQYLTSAVMSSTNTRLREVLRAGQLTKTDRINTVPMSSANCGDSATIEVRRNGILI